MVIVIYTRNINNNLITKNKLNSLSLIYYTSLLNINTIILRTNF